jgi:hypothetical protein
MPPYGMALGFQRNQQMDFRQKNNRLQLGMAIGLLGFVCRTGLHFKPLSEER